MNESELSALEKEHLAPLLREVWKHAGPDISYGFKAAGVALDFQTIYTTVTDATWLRAYTEVTPDQLALIERVRRLVQTKIWVMELFADTPTKEPEPDSSGPVEVWEADIVAHAGYFVVSRKGARRGERVVREFDDLARAMLDAFPDQCALLAAVTPKGRHATLVRSRWPEYWRQWEQTKLSKAR